MFDWRVLIIPVLVVLAGAGVAYVIWRVRSHHRRVLDPHLRNALLCPHCGYDMTGMQVPRCPECGRALGFDATFDQLGIDEQDVIEHVRRKPAPEPPDASAEP